MTTPDVAPAVVSLSPGFRLQSQDDRLDQQLTGFQPESAPAGAHSPAKDPPLGILAKFSGIFAGKGFNTIFRPFDKQGSDNVLELNLTEETLSFTAPLGSVPNRGLAPEKDIFLNGVSYVQSINDVTNTKTGKADKAPSGIHFEPGLWMHVPATTNPVLGDSLVRMGSIPHGTTINAQALAPISITSTAPKIDSVDITPFFIGQPNNKQPFPSQTASASDKFRLPPDLTKFIQQGTITQAILTDPNTVLRNENQGKDFTKTTTFTVSTSPSVPNLGGGTANIAFLQGAPVGTTTTGQSGPNADAIQMSATFWVEEVKHTIVVPVRKLHDPPTIVHAPSPRPGALVPSFRVAGPREITKPTSITVTSTQIQYSQLVLLNFAPLTWPHVSVATLVPKDPVHVPDSAFK